MGPVTVMKVPCGCLEGYMAGSSRVMKGLIKEPIHKEGS